MASTADFQTSYLLGHPIAHSKSPAMYRAVYKKLGLEWDYQLADCETERQAEELLSKREFLSLNITTPYKPHALAAASAKAASAQLAGGANVLIPKGGALIAYNTDGQGCVSYLERMGFSFAGKRVVVCGTGPTALSILHASAIAGADVALLLGRDGSRTRSVLKGYTERFERLAQATIDLPAAQTHHRSFRKAYERTIFKSDSYENSSRALASADLIINATPLGMKQQDPAPFDVSVLGPNQVVFDAVYGHGQTALMAGAQAAGCSAYNGAGMLVAQAVATVSTVCDLRGVELSLTENELFDLMEEAAGFSSQPTV